jgi:hypothetical protein
VTKFGNTKVEQLIDLIFSIRPTESMFMSNDGDNDDAELIASVTTTTTPANERRERVLADGIDDAGDSAMG